MDDMTALPGHGNPYVVTDLSMGLLPAHRLFNLRAEWCGGRYILSLLAA